MEKICYIQETQEVLPGSVQCLRVGLDLPPDAGDLIHLQTATWKNLPTGVKACDVAGIAAEGETLILVENRGRQVRVLPAGIIVADLDLVPPQTVYHPVPQVFPGTVMPEPRALTMSLQ